MSEKYFSDILGNGELLDRLSKDISLDRLSHAYILEGKKGSGRHTIARQVTAAIECEARGSIDSVGFFGDTVKNIPCGVCPSCQKILGQKSPDILTVKLEEDKVTIGVDAIRLMKNDMFIAPNDLSHKVFIIEDADKMTVQAQNAFLLSLEEPPEYILFFLLCENSSDLLETVRSRAPTLRTRHISAEEIEKYLLDNDPRAKELKDASAEDWNSLLSVSAGSVGYALELLEDKKRNSIFALRHSAKELISMLSKANKIGAIETVSAFGSKRQEVAERLTLLQYALRDLLLLKKCESAPLCFFESRDEALDLSDSFTAKSLLSLYDSSSLALDDLDKNSNVRLTLMNMMRRSGLL